MPIHGMRIPKEAQNPLERLTMKRILLAAVGVTALVGTAIAQSNNTASNATNLDVTNAKIEGNRIVGVNVEMEDDGYVVIHDNAAGAPPASLGHIRVSSGLSENLSIEATGALDPANGISLMLHSETNGNMTYDFGPESTDVDTPISLADGVVMAPLPTN